MEKAALMINGLPGNVATTLAKAALKDPRFDVVPASLTGQEIQEDAASVEGTLFTLVKPDTREDEIKAIQSEYPGFIAVDYTHPTAVNTNARFYVKHRIPFVMGTTGGDRKALEETVKKARVPAVIAPNMAKPIVGLQAMMAYAAEAFPGLFKGYTLRVKESHQKAKADTSGTARAMVGYFNRMGCEFGVEEIRQIRDPEVQEKEWGIPRAHLGGHGWHTYTLTAPDGSALLEFRHNINGRDIYAAGTFDAVLFLKEKLADPANTTLFFTMIDVLNNA